MTFWSGSPTTMGRRFVAVLVWTLSAGQEPEEIDCEDDFCFGCQMLNYCNGHGRCSAGGGDPSPFVTCVCDKGWGSPDDIATEKDALCMLRTCPKGRATSDLPFSKNEAHPMRECSNNGVREQGSKRVIQRRFNVSVPRATVPETAPTLRERSER